LWPRRGAASDKKREADHGDARSDYLRAKQHLIRAPAWCYAWSCFRYISRWLTPFCNSGSPGSTLILSSSGTRASVYAAFMCRVGDAVTVGCRCHTARCGPPNPKNCTDRLLLTPGERGMADAKQALRAGPSAEEEHRTLLGGAVGAAARPLRRLAVSLYAYGD
jgi:hypothetical protein